MLARMKVEDEEISRHGRNTRNFEKLILMQELKSKCRETKICLFAYLVFTQRLWRVEQCIWVNNLSLSKQAFFDTEITFCIIIIHFDSGISFIKQTNLSFPNATSSFPFFCIFSDLIQLFR